MDKTHVGSLIKKLFILSTKTNYFIWQITFLYFVMCLEVNLKKIFCRPFSLYYRRQRVQSQILIQSENGKNELF